MLSPRERERTTAVSQRKGQNYCLPEEGTELLSPTERDRTAVFQRRGESVTQFGYNMKQHSDSTMSVAASLVNDEDE